ncbi:MAG: type II toxin-antitoxin system VapC family toxin [Chloroflexi bacterium]|nr:type II toxin-antitoxin system VapC family toxin [Chloroflexota bacterium]
MATYLLDTHIFLWWIDADPRLSPTIRQIMADPDNQLFLSAASVWEMAIKAGLGKLDLEGDLMAFLMKHLRRNAIESMPIQMSHAAHVFRLPLHHRDPFDRLLVAQSQLENMPILTTDRWIKLYDVTVID